MLSTTVCVTIRLLVAILPLQRHRQAHTCANSQPRLFPDKQLTIVPSQSTPILASNLLYPKASPSRLGWRTTPDPTLSPTEAATKATLILSFDGTGANWYESLNR